jgi:hypothetical protein
MSPPDLRHFVRPDERTDNDPVDTVIADLQSRLEEANQKRNEERFLWIVVLVVIFDTAFLSQSNTWSVSIVVGVVELIGLVVVAEKCKVNPIMALIDRLAPMIRRNNSR